MIELFYTSKLLANSMLQSDHYVFPFYFSGLQCGTFIPIHFPTALNDMIKYDYYIKLENEMINKLVSS